MIRGWFPTAVAVCCSVVLSGCGRESADPVVRPDLYFGYYGDCPSCIAETRDHTSFTWVAGWNGTKGHIETIVERAVLAAPTSTVIMLPGMYVNGRVNPKAIEAARAIFTGLRDNGVLQAVVAVYPQDEPDLLGLTDAAVAEANSQIRALMMEFVELDGVPLAVIYSNSRMQPGLSTYDWIGIDAYRLGKRVLDEPYERLRKRMRADQRLLLIPGGASPWEQDPAPFFKRATDDPRVVGVVAFIWFDNAAPGVGAGIRSNGLADRYRRLATQARGPRTD